MKTNTSYPKRTADEAASLTNWARASPLIFLKDMEVGIQDRVKQEGVQWSTLQGSDPSGGFHERLLRTP